MDAVSFKTLTEISKTITVLYNKLNNAEERIMALEEEINEIKNPTKKEYSINKSGETKKLMKIYHV